MYWPGPPFITRWSVSLVISEASSLPAVNVPAMATYPACVVGRNSSEQISALKIKGTFYDIFSCFVLTVYISSTPPPPPRPTSPTIVGKGKT